MPGIGSPSPRANDSARNAKQISVSITTYSERDDGPVARELRSFADVTIEKGKAIVCLVGDGICTSAGTVADIFASLKAAGVTARMISLGASKINVSFLVEEEDVETAVKALHATFF